jgi:uncharacterized protein (DUF2252 family)
MSFPTDRDPLGVLDRQAVDRLPELLPVRRERMSTTPFAFFRGAAAVMAHDLARQPTTGLDVQLCGDAHLGNFGVFASPERRLVFDLNDFDETIRGPWEWDLKRLAASLEVAGRGNAFDAEECREIVRSAVGTYRDGMAELAEMRNLDVWNVSTDVDEAYRRFGHDLDDTVLRRFRKSVKKARKRHHLRSLAKLTELVDGQRRFVADPPLVVPLADLLPEGGRRDVTAEVDAILREYSTRLAPAFRTLIGSYRFVDLARKVGGVGSVGIRCWLVLLMGRDEDDPLFLQVKEARASALAPYLAGPVIEHEGQRVVEGQRMLQAASDVLLGWQSVVGLDGRRRDFYVRQAQDWKGSAQVEDMSPSVMRSYARLCAWTLARAHARSGDRIAIAGYLGTGLEIADALAEFAGLYADRNEQDFRTFVAAGESFTGNG